MSETHELGSLADLADGHLVAFPDIGDDGVVVCRVDGRLHALDDRCSHARQVLSEGRVRGTTLVCPLHGAQFDVRDGSHRGPPAVGGVTCHEIVETSVGVTLTLRSTTSASDPTSGPRTR